MANIYRSILFFSAFRDSKIELSLRINAL